MNNVVFCLCLFALLLFGCADLERNKFYEGDDDGDVVGGVDGSSSSEQNPGSSAQGSQGSSSSVGGSSSQVQGSQSSSSSVRSSSSSVRSSSSLARSSSSSVAVRIGKGNDINNYETVEIGTQIWMAENLDYVVEGSKCYDNNTARCNTYGSLYTWVTAMALPSSCNSSTCSGQIQSPHRGICPSGWHIPSNADWDKLYRYADGTSGTSSLYGSETAGRYLKATSGWNSNGNGTDQYGFSALPGGRGYSDGSFISVGDYGNWWSTSENYSDGAHGRNMSYDGDYAGWIYNFKSGLFSVRCVKD